MKNPALKGEVSTIKKMLKLTNPGLRGSNVVLNSFGNCVSNTPKEFSRTTKMSFSEMVSKPGMFFKKFKGTVSFKQLEGFTNTHSRRKFNKQMDMVSSNVQFIDFTLSSISNLPNKKLTIHPESVKLERVFSIFNFPDKMESILSKAVFSKFQIHFSSPKSAGDKAHANFVFSSEGLVSNPFYIKKSIELNVEDGDSSPSLKVWVSSPLM